MYTFPLMGPIRAVCIAFVITSELFAQAQCPAGDVLITTQADVDAYALAYGTCDTLPGDLRFEGYGIEDLSAFAGLHAIHGDLINWQTYPGPLNFTGFDQLSFIGGDLQVFNCQKFQNFQGLTALEHISGDLDITWCDSLQDLSGLNTLSVVGGDVVVMNNNNMLSALGLAQLDTVHGRFEMHSESVSIQSYAVPNDLDHVGGDLTLAFDHVTDITGGNSLVRVDSGLAITGAALQNISGFNALDVVGDNLFLIDNPQLTSITGFQGLDTIGGWFHFDSNNAMTVFNGFPSLRVVDRIWFEDNSSLTAIHGFQGLDSIGKLLISINPVLTDLQAFDQPIALGELQINNNPLLSYCHVQSVCEHITDPILYEQINGNAAPDCITWEAVYDLCTLSTSLSDHTSNGFNLHPNPVADQLMITAGGGTRTLSARIIDPQGRSLLSLRTMNVPIDVSDLAPGQYILVIEDGRGIDRLRFVKE